MQIILPPGYAESDKRYPVVYMLHSYTGGDNYAWDIKSDYEAALRDNAIQEMILVFPNADNRLGGSMYPLPLSGPTPASALDQGSGNVASHYRTLPQPGREIAGCRGLLWGVTPGSVPLGVQYPAFSSRAVAMSGTCTLGPRSLARKKYKRVQSIARQWTHGVCHAALSFARGPWLGLDRPNLLTWTCRTRLSTALAPWLCQSADPIAAQEVSQQPVRLDGFIGSARTPAPGRTLAARGL